MTKLDKLRLIIQNKKYKIFNFTNKCLLKAENMIYYNTR